MNRSRALLSLAVAFLVAVPLAAKDKKKEKKEFSNVFDAAPAKVYDAAYKYAQHHGKIQYSDDKHMTVTATIYIPGGKWSYRKDYDCTISVEPMDGGKSVVNVVGVSTTKRATVGDIFGKSVAEEVVDGIREELVGKK
jgi:hypothetical protein